jgi:hypothetical protein
MFRKFLLSAGLAFVAVALAIVPALAYVGTPGTTASCVPTTQSAGGTVTCSAHFLGGAGQGVTFSATGGGPGCVVMFSPASATTDASGNVATTVTFGANCSGTVTLSAVAGAQNVSTTATITAFPAASSLPFGVPAPFGWVVVLMVGIGLVGAALLRPGRRPRGA